MPSQFKGGLTSGSLCPFASQADCKGPAQRGYHRELLSCPIPVLGPVSLQAMLRITGENCIWEKPACRSGNLKAKVKDTCRPLTLDAPLGKGQRGGVHAALSGSRAGPIQHPYLDSCFCSRKRSSSSWTRCTKSFSVGERKTPSKQRRARVIGGRACGQTAKGRIRAQTHPPTPQCRRCKSLGGIVVQVSPPIREKQAPRWGRNMSRSPGTTAAGHRRGPARAAARCPRTRARCCGAFVPKLRALAPGSLALGPGREPAEGRGRPSPARSREPGERGPAGRSAPAPGPPARPPARHTHRSPHRSRTVRQRLSEEPQKSARPFASDRSLDGGAAPLRGPGEASHK